jgi:hypothetical protein
LKDIAEEETYFLNESRHGSLSHAGLRPVILHPLHILHLPHVSFRDHTSRHVPQRNIGVVR